jgi:TorA maturation chaperone TorD
VSADAHAACDVLPPEERARANVYGLVGRLFYAAPDDELLAHIRAHTDPAEESRPAGDLERAWQALQAACESVRPDAAKQEHDTLFVGVGKSEVTPYTSHYVADSAPDRHLVALRDELGRRGLTRQPGTYEAEDHITGLCDVMRFLIEQQAPLAEQQLFFERFVYPGALPFFKAVATAASADFYRPVVAFAAAFLTVENAAFEMEAPSTEQR